MKKTTSRLKKQTKGRERSLVWRGFTVIEILTVVLVIAILAAVVYVGYGAWRDNIAETELRNDLSGVLSAMNSAKNWSEDGYPELTADVQFDGNTETKDIFVQSEHVTLTYFGGGLDGYCIDARSTVRPDIYLFMDTASGSTEPKKGTCADGEGATPPPVG